MHTISIYVRLSPDGGKRPVTVGLLGSAIGRPYYGTVDCLVYNGDCLEAMRKLPDGCINLTVTSPPYNIGKEYETQLPLDDYLDWCQQWIAEVYRVTAPAGAFWLNLGYVSAPNRAKALPLSYLLWNKIEFYMMQEIVWNYGAGVAARNFFSPRNEKFLWYVKDAANYTFNLDQVRDPDVKYPNQKKNGRVKVNAIGKNPSDVWNFSKVTSGKNRASKERTPHPAQFPAAVIERIIKCSSNPGDVVMDPFMGSGTTAVVALGLQRCVIGFEIKRDYCNISAKRISGFLKAGQLREAQQSLFG
jgi:adenine-specific DNA-methyltransferase